MLQTPVSLISVAKPIAASVAAAGPSFVQPLNPAHSTLGSTLIALVPIALLLILLPVFRMSAWQAVIIGAAVTIILAIAVWGTPAGDAFGLADVFNYSGMANTMAHGFSRIGPAFLVLAPIVGWIGVALSGSNTSTNALFGGFQYSVGGLLHMPPLLLPSLNSVGAEIGKPVAPQTASVGVSTTKYVRREGQVIRHNLAWTLVILAYLILIALFYRGVLPAAMRPLRPRSRRPART